MIMVSYEKYRDPVIREICSFVDLSNISYLCTGSVIVYVRCVYVIRY